jgi:hypothetical protein
VFQRSSRICSENRVVIPGNSAVDPARYAYAAGAGTSP